MTEYIINDEQIREAVEFTPPYKTLSYVAKYRISGAVNIDGIAVHSLQEIVRCRDCKHMHTVRHWLGMDMDECWLHADQESGALGKEYTEPDGFCAWAERREP